MTKLNKYTYELLSSKPGNGCSSCRHDVDGTLHLEEIPMPDSACKQGWLGKATETYFSMFQQISFCSLGSLLDSIVLFLKYLLKPFHRLSYDFKITGINLNQLRTAHLRFKPNNNESANMHNSIIRWCMVRI